MNSDIEAMLQLKLETGNKAVEHWEKTGLLEGLDEDNSRKIAILLENTALSLNTNKHVAPCYEATMRFIFPLVRKVCVEILQKYDVDVMMLPAEIVEVNGEITAIVAKTKQLKTIYKFDEAFFEMSDKTQQEALIMEELSAKLIDQISNLIEENKLNVAPDRLGKVSLYVPVVPGVVYDDTIAFLCRYASY